MQTYLIYYMAGCYGTFIEWICDSQYNNSFTSIPFRSDGSSHYFVGNILWPQYKIFDFINAKNNLLQERFYCRTHISIFDETNSYAAYKCKSHEEIVSEDLNFLSKNFSKILVLHPTETSKLWVENNNLQKVSPTNEYFEKYLQPLGFTKQFLLPNIDQDLTGKLKTTMIQELENDKASSWNKINIETLDPWELRELLSFYWVTRFGDRFSCWSTLKNNLQNASIQFVSMDELRDFPIQTINRCLQFFDLEPINDTIDPIITKWEKLQIHKDKDQQVSNIIEAIVNNKHFSWNDIDLNLFDEAFIQNNLRAEGLEVKCYNLNQFPKNTDEFANYLEKL